MNPHRACGGLLVALLTAAAAAAEPAVVATLEKTDGTTVSGTLASVSPTEVALVGIDPVAARLVDHGEEERARGALVHRVTEIGQGRVHGGRGG